MRDDARRGTLITVDTPPLTTPIAHSTPAGGGSLSKRSSTSGDDLDVFEAERPRLLGLAYRILGSAVDAEDVVQEAWVRWSSRGRHRASGRMADHRRQPARSRRLAGAAAQARGLRRPVAPRAGRHRAGPAERAELADSLTFGFLVLARRAHAGGASRVPPRRCVRRAVRRHRFDRREVRGGMPSDREPRPAPIAGVAAHETESLVCSARRGVAASGRERGCRGDDGVARS